MPPLRINLSPSPPSPVTSCATVTSPSCRHLLASPTSRSSKKSSHTPFSSFFSQGREKKPLGASRWPLHRLCGIECDWFIQTHWLWRDIEMTETLDNCHSPVSRAGERSEQKPANHIVRLLNHNLAHLPFFWSKGLPVSPKWRAATGRCLGSVMLPPSSCHEEPPESQLQASPAWTVLLLQHCSLSIALMLPKQRFMSLALLLKRLLW